MLDQLRLHVRPYPKLTVHYLTPHNFCTDQFRSYVKRHRTELREKYGIPGTTKNDCWATFCCLPCAQIQMDKEVALREAHRINKDGYRPQDGMTMPNQEPMAPVGQQPMTAAPQPGANGV
jgi:hypothetical protein